MYRFLFGNTLTHAWTRAREIGLQLNGKNTRNDKQSFISQLWVNGFYYYVIENYNKFRDYPVIPDIQCKVVLKALLVGVPGINNITINRYKHSSVTDVLSLPINVDFIKQFQLEKDELTIFEVLNILYMYWIVQPETGM